MITTRTVYRPARQSDFKALHRIAEASGQGGGAYGHPTIVVERDGHLVAFAATRRYGERVVVGPVVVTDTVRLKGLVAIRAVLEIERVLKEEGRLYYLIGTTDAGLMRICEAFGCTYEGLHDDEHWYLRRLRQEVGYLEIEAPQALTARTRPATPAAAGHCLADLHPGAAGASARGTIPAAADACPAPL